MYKILNNKQPRVNPEASGGQNKKDHHHDLSGIITGGGIFNHHQLILQEWCMDLEQTQIYIQTDTLKGKINITIINVMIIDSPHDI